MRHAGIVGIAGKAGRGVSAGRAGLLFGGEIGVTAVAAFDDERAVMIEADESAGLRPFARPNRLLACASSSASLALIAASRSRVFGDEIFLGDGIRVRRILASRVSVFGFFLLGERGRNRR